MKNLELINQSKPEKLTVLADKLNKLQKTKNNGRGVSCLKQIVTYLRMGDVVNAKRFCFTDHDKIRNYPEIKEFIIEKLFKEDNKHPWE